MKLKEGKDIVAIRLGVMEKHDRLVKVIPLSGVYIPRRGNVVIGKVDNITFNGWVIDIGSSENAFLTVMEVPKYVNKQSTKVFDQVFGLMDPNSNFKLVHNF